MSYILEEAPLGADGAMEIRGPHKQFWQCHDREVMLSGGSDTGKTVTALHKIDATAWKYPKAQLAIVRQEASTLAGTVIASYRKHILGDNSPVREVGGVHPEQYIYPNGSIIWLGGLDKPDKVLSSERDVIYVNQAEGISLWAWETLGNRCTGRAGNVPFPQLIGDCNPGPPMHWIRTRAASGLLTLIPTTHRDNPSIYTRDGQLTESGKMRMAALDNLTGVRRARLRDGLWAAPEGAIYDIFDEATHKVKSFVPPPLWPRIVGIDPFGAFVSALWGAFDTDNKVLNIYREYYEPFGITTPEHVSKIKALSSGETIWAWCGGGPSERQARADWTGAGIPLLPCPIDEVWSGIDRVLQLLRDHNLVIHDNCVNLLNEIGAYRRVQSRDGTFTEAIEGKENFHCLDALRYMVGFLTAPREQSNIVYDPVRIGRDW
jgi:phage terminase large subunit